MRLIDADALSEKYSDLEQQAMNMLHSFDPSSRRAAILNGLLNGLYAFKREISDAPTVEAKPVKHGEWEFVYEDTNEELIFECSLCKGFYTRENYCPHCGADMRERGEDDDDKSHPFSDDVMMGEKDEEE